MKKSLVAVSVLGAFAGLAHADDTNVTLYGILDTGIATVSNVQTAAATKTTAAQSGTLTGLENGGIATSRWGIKGTEDLGDGLKAKFFLESQLLPSNGTNVAGEVPTSQGVPIDTETQLFKRGAWVGLSQDGVGEVRFGRQNSAQYDFVTTYDALPGYNIGSLTTNVDAAAATAGSGNVFNTYVKDRYDNAVQLRSADLSGLNLRFGWAFGDVAGAQSQGRIWDFGAEYHIDALKLAASYLSLSNPAAPTAEVGAGTLTTVYGLFATYDFGVALVNGSYTDTKGKGKGGAGFSTFTFGARVPLGKTTLIGEFARDDNQDTDNGARSANKPIIFTLGVEYGLSKRTKLYALADLAHQDGSGTGASRLEAVQTSNFYNAGGTGVAPVAGDNQTAFMVGIDHKF